MAENNRTIIGIFVVLLVVVIAAFAWWWLGRGGDQEVQAVVPATPTPAPVPTPSLEERLSAKLSGTTLSTSDAVVRELAAALSANPKLAAWLVNEDLIRRFTAAVDNIAAGNRPNDQLEFLRPQKGFKVKSASDGTFVIDPASYQRYDVVAAVVASLDTEGTVALYRELLPLIDDAYAEISPPGRSFNDRLEKAFDQLLAVARARWAPGGRTIGRDLCVERPGDRESVRRAAPVPPHGPEQRQHHPGQARRNPGCACRASPGLILNFEL